MTARVRPLPALLVALALWPVAQLCLSEPAQPDYPPAPQKLFPDLFVAVQEARIFADGKAFADAVPDSTPAQIEAAYRAERPTTPPALKAFVTAHFQLPDQGPGTAPPPGEPAPITQHIDALWDTLTRSTPTAPANSSQLPLPYRYVVPGGRFRELYYWDSYFTMLGLAASGHTSLLQDMVRDFAYLIETYGHIPNGTRSYYLSRSQPPFFFAMVGLLAVDDPAKAYAQYLPQLQREYAFWMEGAAGIARGSAHRRVVALPDGTILNRYWDDMDTPRDESYGVDAALALATGRNAPQLYRDIRAAAESGWDFSSRWFADARTLATIDTTEIVPVDLNSLLYGLETAISLGCGRNADAACMRAFRSRAAARRTAMDRYLWDPAAGAYLDYRWTGSARVPRVSAATLYPLFVGLASAHQAAAVARSSQRTLLRDGGIVTTPLETGAQWDAPNGWAPLQWIAISGLRRYGEDAIAQTIACRWMRSVNRVYGQSGKLVEKYDVVHADRSGGGGEYPLQDGFGWTNGVMLKLLALYPSEATATPCSGETLP